MVERNPKKFIQFWNEERELLLERNKEGFRAIDAGPLTLGYRLSNTKSGFDITRRLIYPKGSYVLHMIRMMTWDNRTMDQHFKGDHAGLCEDLWGTCCHDGGFQGDG